MSPWGWEPKRSHGIWRHGARSMHPFIAATPWLTLVLLIVLFWLMGSVLTIEKGVVFELPEDGLEEGETTGLVAVVMPTEHDTLVFFDDSRYVIEDEDSFAALGENLAERAAKAERKTLLVLADKRVPSGQLMKLAESVRKCGVARVLFAAKRSASPEPLTRWESFTSPKTPPWRTIRR